MTKKTEVPYDSLERIFHEPNRMAIMSVLCTAEKGIRFSDLKKSCNLTDGNLNRHLKALSEAKAITIKKKFVDEKPCTTISISKLGLQRFSEYLNALEQVLQRAKDAVSEEARSNAPLIGETVNA